MVLESALLEDVGRDVREVEAKRLSDLDRAPRPQLVQPHEVLRRDLEPVREVAQRLAGLHDHKCEYDKAMTALLDAKALMRRVAAQPLQILRQQQAHLREMRQCASTQAVQRWRKAAAAELQPPRKLALLCGHARAGTTLLEYVIDAQERLVVSLGAPLGVDVYVNDRRVDLTDPEKGTVANVEVSAAALHVRVRTARHRASR